MVLAPWRRQKLQPQRPTRIPSGFLSEVNAIPILLGFVLLSDGIEAIAL